MSTSGSTDFNLVTNGLIDEAFDLCGIGSEGEAITADQYARAKRSLNLIIKAWGTQEHLWLRAERSLTMAASTNSYALTPKPMRVIEVRRRSTSGSIDTPLTEWSRKQYLEQPNKTIDSVPVAFYYDPQSTTGTLYLWPRPSTATASDFTVRLTYLRRMDDFDGSSDDADLPQEWLQALTLTLAEALALKYAIKPDLRREISDRAAIARAELNSWDTEPASLYMQPDSRWQR